MSQENHELEKSASSQTMLCKDHIALFSEAFSKELCEALIDVMESQLSSSNIFKRNRRDVNTDHCVGVPTSSNDEWAVEAKTIIWDCVDTYLKKYLPRGNVNQLFVEGWNIQKTSPSEGYHAWHFEDSSLCNRFCVFTVYLNTVEKGGETEFLQQSARVEPKQGDLLIFPAQFTHVHRGNPPLEEDKYILTGWINYHTTIEGI